MGSDGYMPQAVGPRTKRALEARGVRPVVGDYARYGSGLVAGLPWSLAGGRGRFDFGGERHRYLYHRYKWTWLTERAVEVPIARSFLAGRPPERVLEIGHVLGHYGPLEHTVVDKYEQAPGVLNRDIFELDDLGRFDAVVAISTLEHVGWDEEPRDRSLSAASLEAAQRLIAPGGQLLVTVPVGYHPGLDEAIQAGRFRFARSGALRRRQLGPHWEEVDPASVWGTPYDFLLYSARAVFVGVIDGPPA
jgi:SAM-dependent methyltransferase